LSPVTTANNINTSTAVTSLHISPMIATKRGSCGTTLENNRSAGSSGGIIGRLGHERNLKLRIEPCLSTPSSLGHSGPSCKENLILSRKIKKIFSSKSNINQYCFNLFLHSSFLYFSFPEINAIFGYLL